VKRLPAAAGVALCLVCSALDAQNVQMGVAPGLLIPTGNFGKTAKTGWMMSADVTVGLIGETLGIRVEPDYIAVNGRYATLGRGYVQNFEIASVMGNVVYTFRKATAWIRPYVLGGAGIVRVAEVIWLGAFSYVKPAYCGGVGVAMRVGTGSSRLFAEGKVVTVDTYRINGVSTTFVPVRVGVRFATGWGLRQL